MAGFDVESAILRFLRDNPDGANTRKIAQAIGMTQGWMKRYLDRLMLDGKIRCIDLKNVKVYTI